jgi:two-component system OmpR family response regulator
MQLLVVDDDPAIHMIVDAVLDPDSGFEVAHAHGGEEALTLTRDMQPDVVILDHVMPGMDGPSVLEKLRAEPTTAGIPVIFLTGRSEPEIARSLIARGAKGVITKPFHPAELQAQIEAILAG